MKGTRQQFTVGIFQISLSRFFGISWEAQSSLNFMNFWRPKRTSDTDRQHWIDFYLTSQDKWLVHVSLAHSHELRIVLGVDRTWEINDLPMSFHCAYARLHSIQALRHLCGHISLSMGNFRSSNPRLQWTPPKTPAHKNKWIKNTRLKFGQ